MSVEMLEARLHSASQQLFGLTQRCRELQDRLAEAYEAAAAIDTHLRAELRAGSLDAKDDKIRAARAVVADLKRKVT